MFAFDLCYNLICLQYFVENLNMSVFKNDLNKTISDWKSNLLNSKSLSQNTVDSYSIDIKLLVDFLREYIQKDIQTEDLINLTKQDLRAWFLYRKNKNDSSKSLSRGLSAIKSILRFFIERKQIEWHEVLQVRPPKTIKSIPRPINIENINEILESIHDLKKTDWIIKRDKALLILVYSVGLRISEALNLNRNDILNDSSNFISIIGKGNKIRKVPIINQVKDLLIDYIKAIEIESSEALFINRLGERISASSVQKLMQKSRRLLGLSETVTPHALRHSCATHLMENSGDLRSVQELLGHSSISSTQIYTDVAKKYISDIYDKCHPLSCKKKTIK